MDMHNYSWDDNIFPNIIPHTSISYLRRCEGFAEAKNGDLDAARRVVSCCVKRSPCYADVVALPVIGVNKLPLALAECMSIPICTAVKELPSTRKSMTAIERLLNRPEFVGSVQRGVSYVLVDDVVTQGGTLAELRRYVLEQGGKVVGANVLALSISSGRISPKPSRVKDVERRFGANQIRNLLCQNNIAEPSQLTDSELDYLLRFKRLCTLEMKILAENARRTNK